MDAAIIAYASQKSLFDRLEALANNVANVNTSGFKSDLAVYMKPTGKVNGEKNPIPELKFATDVSQGGLRATGRQLDIAVQGDGFFQAETPLGARYTRSGNFFVGADGSLQTKEGYAVVGDGGALTLEPTDSQLKIGEDGTVVAVTDEGDVVRGKIGVFKFLDRSTLQKVGNAYFKSDSEPEAAEVNIDYKVAQGMLEESNVNQVEQMTEMIDLSRGVQTVAKIILDEGQRVRNAVQRITAKA